MPSLILHHYPLSPFSEKVRAILAYAGVDWQSVIVREMPPRPLMDTLTGGYARVPVAQIGADIFCDSNMIAAEIAALSGKVELDINRVDKQVQDFVAEVEGQIFFACVLSGGSAQLRKKVRASMGWWDIARFAVDRINLGHKATVKVPGLFSASTVVREHLQRVEAMLEQDFLFGNQPNIGDFAAYHSLWFIRDVGEKPYMVKYPKVMAWMDRIKAFNNNNKMEEISAQQSIAVAKNAQPASVHKNEQSDKSAPLNKQVAIAPSDYRLVFSSGVLKAQMPNRWIIERETSETGTVHVHFPRNNYQLRVLS